MKFERLDKDPHLAYVEFEAEERLLINRGLLNLVLNAARDGNKQYYVNDNEWVLICNLLNPDHLNTLKIINLGSNHLDILADSIEETSGDIAYDRAKEVGGFIYELRVASRVLKKTTNLITPSNDEIDRIVGSIEIPDSPDGL